jgi:hypothetical protein
MTESERAELQRYREVQLHDLMSRISEDCACAGWHMGLEEVLYRMTFEYAEREFCAGVVDELDIMQLRRLADETGCWWHWPEDVGDVQKIALDEARRLYGSTFVRRWAVISMVQPNDPTEVTLGVGRDKLWIVNEYYAAPDDVLACGSLPAMEAALRLLGGET